MESSDVSVLRFVVTWSFAFFFFCCFMHTILVWSLYAAVLYCFLVARCPTSLWRKKKEQLQLCRAHTACIWYIYSMFGLLHQSTAAPRLTVYHERVHRLVWVLSGCLGISYESPVVLWAPVHLHESVVNTSLFVSSEGRDGPLSCREEVLTTSWVLIRKGRLVEALSVNIPQVWERQRKGAGEEEGSGWIAALYGQSTAFPRVCGSDPRHDARCCTNSSSAPPSGATKKKKKLHLSWVLFSRLFLSCLGITYLWEITNQNKPPTML